MAGYAHPLCLARSGDDCLRPTEIELTSQLWLFGKRLGHDSETTESRLRLPPWKPWHETQGVNERSRNPQGEVGVIRMSSRNFGDDPLARGDFMELRIFLCEQIKLLVDHALRKRALDLHVVGKSLRQQREIANQLVDDDVDVELEQ